MNATTHYGPATPGGSYPITSDAETAERIARELFARSCWYQAHLMPGKAGELEARSRELFDIAAALRFGGDAR